MIAVDIVREALLVVRCLPGDWPREFGNVWPLVRRGADADDYQLTADEALEEARIRESRPPTPTPAQIDRADRVLSVVFGCLTASERITLSGLALGARPSQISARLRVSRRTVYRLRSSAEKKFLDMWHRTPVVGAIS